MTLFIKTNLTTFIQFHNYIHFPIELEVVYFCRWIGYPSMKNLLIDGFLSNGSRQIRIF